jgi:hypothetical protein
MARCQHASLACLHQQRRLTVLPRLIPAAALALGILATTPAVAAPTAALVAVDIGK